MEPEPEDVGGFVPGGSMAEWDEAQVQRWLGSLGLAGSSAVKRAFAAEGEVDGKELASLTVRGVRGILRRAEEPLQDGAALAKAIIAERDALIALGAPSSSPAAAVSEAPTPRSTRYLGELLFDPARQEERRAALQAAVDAWNPKRWTLEQRELGHGSSGVVFACTDKRLGRVAIKFSHAAEPQKLEREAALMQRVAHENICALREHRLLEKGLFGMVLELMDGGSLQQQIAEAPDHRLPEAAVTEMSLQVLQGLYFMHEKGVIHRDVKPSNIMMCSADPGGESAAAAVRYKLIDLSIAAMDGDVQGAQVETVYFMRRTEAVTEMALPF
eukprot:COSAG01_NODE_9118_length_2545_cov_352.691742_2_plen_329_part_00